MDRDAADPRLAERPRLTPLPNGDSAGYIEGLHARYRADPGAVEATWRDYFRALDGDAGAAPPSAAAASWKRANWPVLVSGDLTNALSGEYFPPRQPIESNGTGPANAAAPLPADDHRATRDSVRAMMLIRAYRSRGHLHAMLDPLELASAGDNEDLHPASYGFTEADLDRPVFLDGALGMERATIRETMAVLRRIYCSTTGYEFMHISDPEQRQWLQDRVEAPGANAPLGDETRRAILDKLVQVKGYERYLDRKFVGTKRFGLDGAEATIPALDEIIRHGSTLGLTDVVLGLAHRGRLNVLSQVMMKPHRAIFNEFKGGSFVPDEVEGSGDVKYHLGASSDRVFEGRKVHLSLTANPSHLEIADPVVLGKVRAKQDQNGDTDERITALPLIIHGDAAFAGQGVVAECFGLSGLKGYRTGGSVHFIINNQIGFTTDPGHSRSSPYPSDLAKSIEAPIFHVNGDDPEAVIRVARLAIEFRQRFHKPAVVDMFCFRLYGHNEGDEPAFTQPVMYRRIRGHRSTLEIYGERLIAEGVVDEAWIDRAKAEWVAHLDQEFEAAETYRPGKADWLDGRWNGLRPSGGTDAARRDETGVPGDVLKEIGRALTAAPAGFKVHPTVQRFLDARSKTIESGEDLDWSTAEALAMGSLALEGIPVRLSGQDSERGTFSQRHSVLNDQDSGARFTPLNGLRPEQARCEIVNSMLSEEAVLAFEYGYTLAEPNALVLWEAQFGDFANGAQVVFDQFLSSGERKWLRMSGLVCLLPHGFDGQGPEHSSARLERFLQSCAEDNWQVANCSTPANYFHILRRQIHRDFRKPLMLMTPKNLLRHRRAKSAMSALESGSSFHAILRDDAKTGLVPDKDVRRVILCSGKVYYDLYDEREKRGIDDVYLLRIEQLYPFPGEALAAELERFPHAMVLWCQEEPRNMGAWKFVEEYIETAMFEAHCTDFRLAYVGRPAAASPATGQMSQHLAQLADFLEKAFAP